MTFSQLTTPYSQLPTPHSQALKFFRQRRCTELRELIREADVRFDRLSYAITEARRYDIPCDEIVARSTDVKDTPSIDPQKVLDLASAGMDSAAIAKATGLDCAEVNLLLSLQKKGSGVGV